MDWEISYCAFPGFSTSQVGEENRQTPGSAPEVWGQRNEYTVNSLLTDTALITDAFLNPRFTVPVKLCI